MRESFGPEISHSEMSSKFRISELNNAYQKLAIQERVAEMEDIFVNLPTETVKPLIHQPLPFVFHQVSDEGHIIVVGSPFVC